ncbi:MAG: DNA-processing protein DprA [Pseudomonadota bacterium]
MQDWLRFSLIPGIGDGSQRRLLEAFGSPAAALAASRTQLAPHLRAKQLDAWQSGADAALLAQTLEWLDADGHHLVTWLDSDYPEQLREIADPPVLLYAKGRRELLTRNCIAVVGSRSATAQGEANAEAFAALLSQAGITIVSGLALGIDAAAHRGGLKGAGSTIAVVGTGLDRVYPARNKSLAHEIAQKGLLLSEFPLGTVSAPGHFPKRNRIISGLSHAVLVVEAALNSGSLITARLALEQGREVMAIPGSIHSPLSKGCHALIKQGAKLVESAQDIVEELAWPAIAAAAGGERPTPGPDTLLQHLGYDPVSLEQLVERSGLTVEALSAKLLTLELEGLVAQLPGGRYQRLES